MSEQKDSNYHKKFKHIITKYDQIFEELQVQDHYGKMHMWCKCATKEGEHTHFHILYEANFGPQALVKFFNRRYPELMQDGIIADTPKICQHAITCNNHLANVIQYIACSDGQNNLHHHYEHNCPDIYKHSRGTECKNITEIAAKDWKIDSYLHTMEKGCPKCKSNIKFNSNMSKWEKINEIKKTRKTILTYLLTDKTFSVADIEKAFKTFKGVMLDERKICTVFNNNVEKVKQFVLLFNHKKLAINTDPLTNENLRNKDWTPLANKNWRDIPNIQQEANTSSNELPTISETYIADEPEESTSVD